MSKLTASQITALKTAREAAIDTQETVLDEAEDAEVDTASTPALLAEWYHSLEGAHANAHSAHQAAIKAEADRPTRKSLIVDFNNFFKRHNNVNPKLRAKLDNEALKKLRQEAATRPGSSVSSSASTVAMPTNVFSDLPKLSIPSFDGNFMAYQTWLSMFNKTIAPFRGLDDSRKVAFLHQALHESVRERMDFDVNATYDTMMATLEKYYRSSYRLAQEMLATLQAAPKLVPSKPNEFQRLTTLTRTVRKAVAAFSGNSLGELLVMAMLETKLPDKKRHQFKLLFATATPGGVTDPNLSQVLQYMENLSINHGSHRMVSKRMGVHVMHTVDEATEDTPDDVMS